MKIKRFCAVILTFILLCTLLSSMFAPAFAVCGGLAGKNYSMELWTNKTGKVTIKLNQTTSKWEFKNFFTGKTTTRQCYCKYRVVFTPVGGGSPIRKDFNGSSLKVSLKNGVHYKVTLTYNGITNQPISFSTSRCISKGKWYVAMATNLSAC